MKDTIDTIDSLNIKSTRLRFALHYLLKSQDGTDSQCDLGKAKAWIEREEFAQGEARAKRQRLESDEEKKLWPQKAITHDTPNQVSRDAAQAEKITAGWK